MLPLVVRVERLQTKESTVHVFTSSPVRLGRNNLNDLPLDDPFVSLWHGMLQFDDKSIHYLDLASKNGSELNGARTNPNTLIPLGSEADLLIGPLRVHVSRGDSSVEAPPKPRSMTMFERRVTQDNPVAEIPAILQVPSPTLYWQATPAVMPPTAAPAPTTVPPPGAPPPNLEALTGRSFSEETWPAATANALLPRYMKYRDAWDKLNKQVRDAIASVPVARRARALELLSGRLPALGQEQEFRSLLTGEPVPAAAPIPSPVAPPIGASSPALVPGGVAVMPDGNGVSASLPSVRPLVAPDDGATVMELPGTASMGGGSDNALLALFIETYAPGSKRVAHEQFLKQLSAVLEAFAQSFIELRRGQEEFNKQMAVPSTSNSSLRRATGTARDILRQLLDAGPEGATRIRDLTGGFADVMVHQVALLSGIREGVRSLLGHLHPDTFAGGKPDAGRFSTSLSGLVPFRSLSAWNRFVSRYRELTEEDRAIEGALFGPEFAFAYTRIVGGPGVGKKPTSSAGAAPPTTPRRGS